MSHKCFHFVLPEELKQFINGKTKKIVISTNYTTQHKFFNNSQFLFDSENRYVPLSHLPTTKMIMFQEPRE